MIIRGKQSNNSNAVDDKKPLLGLQKLSAAADLSR